MIETTWAETPSVHKQLIKAPLIPDLQILGIRGILKNEFLVTNKHRFIVEDQTSASCGPVSGTNGASFKDGAAV